MMVHKLQPTIGATLFILWRRLTEVRFGLLTETHTGEGILRPSLPSRLHPEPSGNEAKRCLNCSICVVPRYMDVTAERLVRQPPRTRTSVSGKSCPVPFVRTGGCGALSGARILCSTLGTYVSAQRCWTWCEFIFPPEEVVGLG